MKILLILLLFATTGVADMKLHEKLDLLNTVVFIRVVAVGDTPGGTGSGVIVHSEKKFFKGFTLIVTALHVVKNAKAGNLLVTVYPSGKTYPAYVVKTSEKVDLALVRIDVPHKHVAKRATPEILHPFTKLIKVGCGLGEDPFPTLGIVESFEDDTGLMKMSTMVIFGDSGGGIFLEETGELVGIIQGTAVTGFSGHPVLVPHIGLAYNTFAINEFLSE